MKQKIKISIIVPVYNIKSYLKQCVDSLISQTLKDIEIILINDGSNDSSPQLCELYARQDSRIKVIHQQNNGPGDARNTGLKYAQGEYIGFVDSDDWVDTDFFEKLYLKAKKENADISCGNSIYYLNERRQHSGWVDSLNFKSGKDIIVEDTDKQYTIYACACWAKIYKKEILDKYDLKFPKGLYIEDVFFTFFSSMFANKIVLVKDTKLYYRQRFESIMKQADYDEKPFDIFKIYEYCDEFLEEVKKHIIEEKYITYKKILENFKIFNIYNWFEYKTCKDFKAEYRDKMKNVFLQIDIKNNEFITKESEAMYKRILNTTIL